jgi:hypothetical protein
VDNKVKPRLGSLFESFQPWLAPLPVLQPIKPAETSIIQELLKVSTKEANSGEFSNKDHLHERNKKGKNIISSNDVKPTIKPEKVSLNKSDKLSIPKEKNRTGRLKKKVIKQVEINKVPAEFSSSIIGSKVSKEDLSVQNTNSTSKQENHSRYNPEKKLIPPILPNQKSAKTNFPGQFEMVGPGFELSRIINFSRKNKSPEISINDKPSTVKVHIGRIEIKAINKTMGEVHTRKEPKKPKISLDQFLNNPEGKSL